MVVTPCFVVCSFGAYFCPWEPGTRSTAAYLQWSLTEWKDQVRNLFVSVGSAGIVLQAGLIYLFSALLKTGASWQDGTAVYLALNVDYITWRAPSDFLLQFPELIAFLTQATWHLELYGPLLLLTPIFRGPIRTIACFLFIGLHLGFASFMTLGLFPFIGAAMWVGLLPGWFWDHVGRLPGVLKKLAGLRETESSRISPQAHSRWWVQCLALVGIYGMVTWNLSTLPEKGPCPDKFTMDNNNAFCMGKAIDKKVSSKLARSVQKINEECPSGYEDKGQTCSQIDRDQAHAIEPVDGTCPNTYELTGDYCIIKSEKLQHAVHIRELSWADKELYNRDIDEWIRPLIKMVRLDQKWNMFAPNPLTNDGWYILKGQLIDGSEVKLFPSGPLDESKPEQVSDLYVDQRWRKYMRNLQTNYKSDKNRSKSENEDFKGSIFRLHFGKYVCKSFNRDRTGDARLETFQIWTMNEVTHPPSWSPRSKVHATFKLHQDKLADITNAEGTIDAEACAEACIENTKIDAEVSRCELKDTNEDLGPLKLLEEMHSIRCSGIQLIKVKKESAPPMWSHRCLKP